MLKTILGNKTIVRKILLAIFCSFFLVAFAVLLIYFLLVNQTTTYFLKVYETKTLAQLEAYHEGRVTSTKDFFKHILDIATRLSDNTDIVNALRNGNFTFVQELLDNQRTINQHLETWSIFDKSGKMVVVSTSNLPLKTAIGNNFKDRKYFQAVMKTKKPYISQLLSGVVTNAPFIDFSVPILDKTGSIEYVLNGSTRLQVLQQQLELNSHFSYHYNILVDWSGDVLFENGKLFNSPQNIKDSDKLFARLLDTTDRVIEEEINYKNERVIAMGDKIQAASNPESAFYLMSYIPKSEFDNQTKGLKTEIRRIFVGVIVIVSVVFILLWTINLWLLHLYVTNKQIITEWKKIIKNLLP